KPHALVAGARIASGDWLLFTDADTEHRPGSLRTLVARAEESGLSMLSISPGQRLERWWERAVIPLVFAQLAQLYRFADVSNPHSPVAAANGQYILIRREIYESTGGHAAAPDAILEDVALAGRVKAAGGGLLFLPGAEWAETRMYGTFGAMWQGWTKNLFLLLERDTGKIRNVVLERMLLDWLPGVLAPILFAFAVFGKQRERMAIAGFACLGVFAVRQGLYRRQLRQAGFPPRLAKYIFAGAPLVSALMLNSMRAYRAYRSGRPGGSIRWKGRSYPAQPAPSARLDQPGRPAKEAP
ncbi:MAG: glycosyltransferase, partial [Terriglobia bacterium]